MGATLDALHRLQQIEVQIRGLEERIEARKRTVNAQKRRLATLQRQIDDNRAAARAAQSEADRIELERKTHEAHVNKLREDLNRAKTNKEYAAILSQLNTDKADAMKTEDQVLAALSRVDELKISGGGLAADFEKQQARVRDAEEQAGRLSEELADELSELQSQREVAAADVPPEALRFFERARDKHEGEAMAMIEKPHPRRSEYICSGCNMSVPLEIVNALQTRDDVQMCQICSRILYLEVPSSVSAK